jgi:hypothetical protein
MIVSDTVPVFSKNERVKLKIYPIPRYRNGNRNIQESVS